MDPINEWNNRHKTHHNQKTDGEDYGFYMEMVERSMMATAYWKAIDNRYNTQSGREDNITITFAWYFSTFLFWKQQKMKS